MTAYAIAQCGCAVERDMFGDREILNVSTCFRHAQRHQKELAALAEAIFSDPLPTQPTMNDFLSQVMEDSTKAKKGMITQTVKRKKKKAKHG